MLFEKPTYAALLSIIYVAKSMVMRKMTTITDETVNRRLLESKNQISKL